MSQLTFAFEVNTKRGDPLQSFQAGDRVNLGKSCLFALQTFRDYPGRSRDELVYSIGFVNAERACKRSSDLAEGLYRRTGDIRYKGLIRREKAPNGEYRNFITEKGLKVLENENF